MENTAILQAKTIMSRPKPQKSTRWERVYGLMKMNGMNEFQDLAEAVGISKQLLSKYLNDEGRIPNWPALKKMAEVLHTTPDFIDESYREALQMKQNQEQKATGGSARTGNVKNISKSDADAGISGSEDYREKYFKTLEENLRLREELDKYRKN